MNDLWDEIAAFRRSGGHGVVATVARTRGSVPRQAGAKMLVRADGTSAGSVGGGLFESLVVRDGLAALREGRPSTRCYDFNEAGTSADAFGAVCGGRAEVLFEPLLPPESLLIVGGGHCGRALARAAVPLGLSVTVADDRPEFAIGDGLPDGVATLACAPDYADLPEPDERTYVALVSKGFVSDEAALRRLLRSPAAYIGMIGSAKKAKTVFDALERDGFSKDELARVKTPIGLPIGADTPEEIAVAILAEIIQVRAEARKKSDRSAGFDATADEPFPTVEENER